jgi:hypothetical protein
LRVFPLDYHLTERSFDACFNAFHEYSSYMV